ncbi:MAG: hypothetical protein ACR2LC_09490 [Pyrinomonadaceae bacterium]
MRLSRIAFFLLLIPCVSSETLSQKKIAPRSKQSASQDTKEPPTRPTKRKEDRYINAAFDIKTEKLPPNFHGADARALYSDLAVHQVSIDKKGEFETTEDYRRRVENAGSSSFLGVIKPDSVLAFEVMNSSGETLYNADTQTMNVVVALTSVTGATLYDDDKTRRAITSQADVESSEYEASNAYGAKVTVTRNTGKDFEIAFHEFPSFGMTRYVDSRTREQGFTGDSFAKDVIHVDFKTDIPAAKKIKSNLRVLAVAKLLSPYTSNGKFYNKPTRDDPNEFFIQYDYLNAELLELWVYDISTGQVYAKKKRAQP